MERYARQTMLAEIGEEGQRRLAAARVLIVGVGGLGSPVALYLAGAGVGTIGLIDSDVVSLTNLQRQVLYTEAEIGLPKVQKATARLKALNSEIKVNVYPEGLTAKNAEAIMAQYDLVIDCCDNYPTRYLIDDYCHTLWVHGSIGEFHGQVAVFGGRRHFADLYAEREELCALPRKGGGVIGPVPGVIGSIQACEAIKIVAGVGCAIDGKLFTIDLLTLQTNLIEI